MMFKGSKDLKGIFYATVINIVRLLFLMMVNVNCVYVTTCNWHVETIAGLSEHL